MKSIHTLRAFASHPLRVHVIGFVAVFGATTLIVGCGDDVTVPKASLELREAGGGASAGLSGRAAGRPVDAMSKLDATALAASPAAQSSAPPPPSPNQAANPTAANPSAAAIVAPTLVIRNGVARLEVDSLELAIAAVEKLATSMGGYIGNTTLNSGANEVRSADLEVKIPAVKYDATVNNLAPIGKVESQISTTEDVGEEFFDITARQANAKRLEERLITLLATRTGKLEDVLAVERELARVREEIERYEGRLRYLKAHIATSTLTVSLHEKRPVVSGYQGRNPIIEAFKDAWRNFVRFIAFVISSLGVIIPLGALLIVIGIFFRRSNLFARRSKRTDNQT